MKTSLKNNERKLPKFGEGNRHTSPGSTERPIPRHTIIKMSKIKDKERILKAAREKKLVTYRGVPKRLSADLSKETL